MLEHIGLIWPEKIEICEVGPRDGLQNEKILFKTQEKIELIEKVVASGVRNVEIGSFVSLKAVPQMADIEEVARKMKRVAGVEYSALIFNIKGMERAKDAGIEKCKLTLSVSEGHSLANSGQTPKDVLKEYAKCVEYAGKNSMRVSAALAVAFGCCFDGKTPLSSIVGIIDELTKLGIREIALADTTGMGTPNLVYDTCVAVKQKFPFVQWALHFHNTRGLGIANAVAGMLAGVKCYDASFAGLGGCPFVPGAAGNIATEDLVNMCDEMGVQTGIDLVKLIEVSRHAKKMTGHSTDSFVLRAGRSCDLIKK